MARRSLTFLLTEAERAGAPLRIVGEDLEIYYEQGGAALLGLNDLRRADEALIFIALEEALGYTFPVHQTTLTDALGYYLLQRIEYAMLPDEHLPPGLLHVLLRIWPFELAEVKPHGELLELRGRLKEVEVHFRIATIDETPTLKQAKSVRISAAGDLNRFDFSFGDQTLQITGYVEEVIEALAADLVF